MGNKSLRRHSNVSFLFIISQVVKKESDLLGSISFSWTQDFYWILLMKQWHEHEGSISKSMNDRNEAAMYNIRISKVVFGMFRNFVFSFSFPADIVKDELEYLVNSSRKFWQKGSVIKEELSAFFRDSKKNMSVFNIENMLLNIFSPCHRIPVTARRAELRLANNGEQVCNRTARTFELDKTFWNISAGKKFINGKFNIFKVTVANIIFLAKF